MNNHLTQLNKNLIDLKNYTVIGSIKSNCYTNMDIIQEKKTGKRFIGKTNSNKEKTQIEDWIIKEINILINIHHSTLNQYRGFSYQDSNITIIMNYIENESLSDFLEKEMQLLLPSDFSNTKRQIILTGIAYGMMILHQHNVIHCDLKPENILLGKDYKPIISDFGLSKIFGTHFSTNQPITCNTIFYTAPEVIIGNNYSSKSDVFSFGILMYEVVTGSRAFRGRFNDQNIVDYQFLKEIIEGLRPEFNAPIKKSMKNLIEKCWSNDPKERPTFSELFDKLSLSQKEEINKLDDNERCCLDSVDFDELLTYVDEITNENNSRKEEEENEDEKLLNVEKLCQQILSLDVNNFVVPDDLPDDSKKLIFLLLKIFPDESKIRLISKDLKTKSFNDAIKCFVFPVCHSHLEKIYSNLDLFKYQCIFEIFTIFAFYTWISIHLLFLQNQQYDFAILLSILNHIIQICSNDQEKIKYRILSISCFVNIIKTAVEKTTIEYYEPVFKEVSIFLVKNKNLPKHSDDVIKALSLKILTQKPELNSQQIELMDLITSIFNQNPEVFSQKVIWSILKSIKTFIINLNPVCLKFFLQFAGYIEMNDFMIIFKPIIIQTLTNVVSVHSIVDSSNQQIKFDDDIENLNNQQNTFDDDIEDIKNQLKPTSNDDNEIIYPPDDLYQIDKIDESNLLISLDVKDLSTFISPQILPIIVIIEQIINLNESYTQYFFEEATENLQSIDLTFFYNEDRDKGVCFSKRVFFEQCAIVFYLVSSSLKKYFNISIDINNGVIHHLFKNEHVFDPKITYFSQNSYFDVVNSLRDFIFMFLIQHNSPLLNQIFQNHLHHPYLLRECVSRIYSMQNSNQNPMFNFRLSFLIDTLIKSLINYRINSSQTKINNKIISTRKMIFFYLCSYLQDDSIIAVIFDSPDFIKSFLALLMEPPIRRKFIGYLSKYLSTTEFSQNENLQFLCESIINLFKLSCQRMNQKEASALLSDVLNSLNKAIIVNKSLAYMFVPIAQNICQSLLNVKFISDKTEVIDNIALPLISFLASTYYEETLKANDISLFESTIIHFSEIKSQEKIMQILVQIIADQQMETISPTFEIKHSKLLCSFVRIFLHTNFIYRAVKFISDLCSYSSENCIKCHEGKLDSLILNIIGNWRKTVNEIKTTNDYEYAVIKNEEGIIINERLIDLFLHLLTQIASIVSSAPVVNNFFSMLCPIDSKYLSLIHKNIIHCLNEILTASKYSPLVALPMDQTSEIQIQNIPAHSFDEGMSFSFWILLPSVIDGFIQDVISLNDDEKHKFKLKLIDKSLRVIIQSGTIFYSSDFQLSIPIKTWTMITVTLSPKSNNQGINISLHINNDQIKNLYTFTSLNTKTPMSCVINRSKQVPKDNAFKPPFVGLFLLSKQLTEDEIATLYNEGQRNLTSTLYLNKIIFAYTLKKDNSYLTLSSFHKLEEISETYPQIEVQNTKLKSFSDLLINNCNVSLIIPNFGLLDIPLKDGSKIQNMIEINVDILVNLFNLGEEAQCSFYSFDGFYSIAYLLQSANKSHISFDLYQRFFNLLNIISFDKLQQQLIDAILMNTNLWSKCGIEQQLKIFTNWSDEIYPSYKSMVDYVRSIDWFLLTIHHFYVSDDKYHLKCRNKLFEIALDSIMTNISSTQISIVIGFICINESSLSEKKEMLNFILTILSNKQMIIDTNIRLHRIIPFLFTIVNLQNIDDDILIRLISVLIILYKYKGNEIRIRLNKIIQRLIILLHVKHKYLFHEDIFSALISLMNANKAPDILPILCVNAILGGSNYLLLMLKNMDRKLNYYTCEQSPIYTAFLLFAFHQNTYLYNEIIRMNITLFKKHWNELVNAINAIGLSCFDANTFDNIKHDVLYKITIMPKIKQDDALLMIRVIKDFIFFRPEKSQLSVLTHLLNQDQDNIEKAPKESDSEATGSYEIDEDDPSISVDPAVNPLPNSLPSQALYAYSEMNKRTAPSSFHVRFDLDTAGPVDSSKNNTSEITFSEDVDDDAIRTNVDEFKCEASTINVFTNLFEMIQNEVKSDLSDRPIASKYKFGLRFNDSSEKWLDLDLAKGIFNLYRGYKILQYSEIMNIVALFLYQSDPSFINKRKKFLIEFNPFLDELKKANNYSKMESQLITHDDMISHHIMIFTNSFINFYKSSLNDPSFTNKVDMNELMMNYFNKQMDKININDKCMRIWRNLWYTLTIARSPWSDSISNISNVGYKREKTFYFANCQSKVKKILNYDKHIKASLKRDKRRDTSLFNSDIQTCPLFNLGLKPLNQTSPKSDNKETYECKLETIENVKTVSFKIENKSILIFNSFENKTICIPSDEINSILYSYKNTKFSGIQIFTKESENYFLIFNNNLAKSVITRIRAILSIDQLKVQNENPKIFINSLHLTDLWINGFMSNFEYLMYLNILSGRTFNDASQYPVFPWVICDFESQTLDLDNKSVYRDFSKPIGKVENNENLLTSSSVFNYLIRIEPFTTKHIESNKGKFADASEIFNSIEGAFQNSKEKFTELIPEFFYFPEFLTNMNELDLGTVKEKAIGDVILPPWSNNSPLNFIYLHRKALESDIVSSHLNEWIDMVWGCQQESLFRCDTNSDEDEIQSINGRCPIQLFDEKHPKKRKFFSKSSIQAFSSPNTSLHLSSSSSSLADYAHKMDSLPSSSSHSVNLSIKNVLIDNDSVHHSSIKFFEITSLSAADVSLLSSKNKLYFTLLDSKGNIFFYSVDFSSLKYPKFILKAQNIKKAAENVSIEKVAFIDSKRFCLIEKANLSILKIVNIQNGLIEKIFVNDFDIVSLDANQEGFLAFSTSDTSVTVCNVNRLLNSKQTESAAKADSFSSFSDNVSCLSICPSFNCLMCGTIDNCLLFCQLKLNKINVNRVIQINGQPQKIIVTDVFGFVAVLMSKIKNGEVFEKIVLFTINGQKIRSSKIGGKRRIVAMTKASSSPGCFDFLIVADDTNCIFVLEAFYLDFGEPVFKCNSKIIKLTYIKEESLIIAFCEDGTASIIYYPIIE